MILLLSKEYDGESIVDIARDVHEAIDGAEVPGDEHGFARGTFKVLITFEEST